MSINSDRNRANAGDPGDVGGRVLERGLRRRAEETGQEGQPLVVPEPPILPKHPEAHACEGSKLFIDNPEKNRELEEK